jgi:AbrB family looped-hinge helix DNA binding protein
MEVETVKMSSRGQVVIPLDIREGLHAREGTVFAVMGSKDTVILKKIEKPSKEALIRELTVIAKEGRRRLEKKGIKESDIPEIVKRSKRQ